MPNIIEASMSSKPGATVQTANVPTAKHQPQTLTLDLSEILSLLQQLVILSSGMLTGMKSITDQLTNIQKTIKFMLSVADLNTLFGLVVQLIQAKNTDDTTIADLKTQISQFSDPALQASLTSLITAATSAIPDPNAPPVAAPATPTA